jgi:hypothetical protein
LERAPALRFPKEARVLYGKSHKPANILIRKMMSVGIVRKTLLTGNIVRRGVRETALFSVSGVDAIT